MTAAGDDLALPRGFRDILPTEARELHLIRDTLMRTFGSYGYVPIEPPSVERARAATGVDEHRVLRFLDRDGRLVALRPDVTTALARLVAQRYASATDPLRLSYFAPVFREEPAMRGAEREFGQAGVELVGASGVVADAEVLALLNEALTACGMRSFTIEVGHVGILGSLFARLAADAREEVTAALRSGDEVGAFRAARAAGMSEDGIARARSVLAARGRAIEGVDLAEAMEVRETIHRARDLFPGEALWGMPNLALVPELPYYTGVVFEVISANLGSPIAAGGRYDALLAAFGAPRPATGFAINVPRLHQALFADGWTPPADRPLIVLAAHEDTALLFRAAASLRRAGLAVAIGAVAEAAGQRTITAQVVDDAHVRIDGRAVSAVELAREIGT